MKAQMSASRMPATSAEKAACSDDQHCLHTAYMSCYAPTVVHHLGNNFGTAAADTVCIAAQLAHTDAAQPIHVTQQVLMSSPALAA